MSLPLIEAILLELHQSFGCEGYPTAKKTKFANAQDSLSAHNTMGQEVLERIFDALGMMPQTRFDAISNLTEFAGAYKSLEQNTWTFQADRRQILWMLLGYFYIPGIARRMALWSLPKPLDRGMPGGRFWYLPEPRIKNGVNELYLPVAQVVDWLLDLLDMPIEHFTNHRGDIAAPEDMDLRRSLYNWRSGTTIQTRSIEAHFSDSAVLDFGGAFTLDAAKPPAAQFDDAIAFVARKRLTADHLRLEIPMTQPDRLEAILRRDADDEERAQFVVCLLERYSSPSMNTVRQRLLVARAVQDGYVRLLKLLCPGVDSLCADPELNKLLQALGIYKHAYNLTIAAWRHCGDLGEQAENAWFEDKLPPWDAHGIYLSILPSHFGADNTALAELLTRRFSEMKPGDTLEDHVGLSTASAAPLIKRNIERLKAVADEYRAETGLAERLRTGSAWRALQSESRFRIIAEIAQRPEFGAKVQQAAVQRLQEVAGNASEALQAMLIELSGYLNAERGAIPAHIRARVSTLLEEAASNTSYDLWKAPVLQYKAKHLLACNDFDGAGKLFREALEAARLRCYGPLRGEIARDCLALAVADRKLIRNNHEKYFREMLAGGMVESEGMPAIEDVARGASTYFWETLYKPYSDVERRKRLAIEVTRKILSGVEEPLITGDQSRMHSWIKSNSALLKSGLPDVEGNSVLMLLIKMRTAILKAPAALAGPMLESWGVVLRLLVEHAPGQLNISDLKNQTPLMLMAEAGNTEVVTLFLKAGADPDMQDSQGMTALHSAIKSRVNECVDVLLEHPCSLDLVTDDGQSPLHTAGWTGNLHAAQRLMKLAPQLAWQRNDFNMTPLERVEYLTENPEGLRLLCLELERQNNRCPTKGELLEVLRLLENAEPLERDFGSRG